MNQWPVLFLSLKSVEGLNFQDAYGMFEVLTANLCSSYAFLYDSKAIDSADKEAFRELQYQKANKQNLKNSLLLFTRMMATYYGKPVILLIDEYDVPLAKASENGYYEEMLDMIRSILGSVLKTNPYLKFAVITGCLRISKESIFTGVNNLVTDSILGGSFNEWIGFTPREVKKLLADVDLSSHFDEIRQWYDGYRFGNTDVYCPWDVLNHVNVLRDNPQQKPRNYWGNTSHNAIIRQSIDRRDLRERENIGSELETLIAGGTIRKPVREDLTYDTLHSTSQHIWSLLLLTGYLTLAADEDVTSAGASGDVTGTEIPLRIPNEEIRTLFRTTVQEWFRDKMQSEERTELFRALWAEDSERSSQILSDLLYDTISYYDYKEDFYRAFLIGVISCAGYKISTNKEQGEGRPDIVLRDERNGRAVIMELKWTRRIGEMNKKCSEALAQVSDRRYDEALKDEYEKILCCGICFYKKRCMVKFKHAEDLSITV